MTDILRITVQDGELKVETGGTDRLDLEVRGECVFAMFGPLLDGLNAGLNAGEQQHLKRMAILAGRMRDLGHDYGDGETAKRILEEIVRAEHGPGTVH